MTVPDQSAPYKIEDKYVCKPRPVRVVCIGAGASGIYTAIRQEQLLQNVSFQIYEKNNDVGGTWLENIYPGCSCDVPSHNYTYSFEPKTDWSMYYAGSDEIQEYFKGVAMKYGVLKYIKFSHRVVAARWNDETGLWNLEIETDEGNIIKDDCNILLNATGILNAWKWPDIPGLHDFKGKLLHTAKYDRSWDIKGKTVALLGNGSSAIQVVPTIQPDVAQLKVFIRSPTWISMPFFGSMSKMPDGNPIFTEEEKEAFRKDPEAHLNFRVRVEDEMNHYFDAFQSGSDASNQFIAACTDNMKEALAKKPELLDTVLPKWPVGCRRITPGIGYLEALCEDNVSLYKTGIARITEHGLIDNNQVEHKVDGIICATGFDVSFAPRFTLTGKNGYVCGENLGKNPKGYLSLALANLPNYFIYYGPQASSANGSFLSVLELTGDYIMKAIEKIQTEDIKSMVVKEECIEEFTKHSDAFFPTTVFATACRSWYKNGTTDGRVTAVWPGSTLHYLRSIRNPRWEDYDWEYLNPNSRFSYLGNGTSFDEFNGLERAWYLRERIKLFDDLLETKKQQQIDG